MELQVYVRGAADAATLRSFAEEKLTQALRRFAASVVSATMRLEDITGPDKGGVDKSCTIEVKLRFAEIRISEQAEEFPAAIHRALDRLKAALSRQASRAKRGVGEG